MEFLSPRALDSLAIHTLTLSRSLCLSPTHTVVTKRKLIFAPKIDPPSDFIGARRDVLKTKATNSTGELDGRPPASGSKMKFFSRSPTASLTLVGGVASRSCNKCAFYKCTLESTILHSAVFYMCELRFYGHDI